MKVQQIKYDELVEALSKVQRQRNELLVACKLALKVMQGDGTDDTALAAGHALQDAINKAEGGK